jgi:hypothetical protein
VNFQEENQRNWLTENGKRKPGVAYINADNLILSKILE